MNTEKKLNQGLDFIIDQLEHNNTIERLKQGRIWRGFQQVGEWESKYGYKFHIYSNDHLIDNKPHFHLIKESEKIDCRIFFDGVIYDCKKNSKISKKITNALDYFLSQEKYQTLLIEFWNQKNPNLIIS